MVNPVLNSLQPSSALMTIAISGSTGLIGSAAIRALQQRGHAVRPIVRRAARADTEISWDPQRKTIDVTGLNGVDAVINLAGEPLSQRWSDRVKQRIRESRVDGTATLARAIASLETKPAVMLSGSAIGIYGRQRGDETLDESSRLGDDFLASVAKDWEAATKPAVDAGIRVVNLRTGLVVSPDGGALEKMLPPFRLGVGGRFGDGRQWMSWIALTDYVSALAFLLDAASIAGPVNLVAPNPVTNEEFTRVLGRVLRRPAIIHVPRAALTLALGEMAEATVLASQRVRPRRLLEAGFNFSLPTLEAALRAELTRSARSDDR
jgi:uncharacterized protein (TIGR01777 family)